MTAEIRPTFSRGPWVRKGSDATVVDADGATIGSVFTFGTEDRRLLVAAPDLYEVVRYLAQVTHQAYHDGEPLECRRAACKEARAALAKADGSG